ncbi:MAG TPA: hypothetical protein VFA43_02060 [Gemmatimonadaceae bacterium]|nr:hypothetical protein [Gemmatimonadaceae bacterium]
MGLAACGSSTAPGGISIGGHWAVTVTNLSGGGHVCNGGFDVNFAQSFNSFNGQYANNAIVCTTSSGNVPLYQGSGMVTDGKVDGQSISYQLDNASTINFNGNVNVSTISGGVTWVKDFGDGSGPVTLSGSWTAQKQ